MMKETLVDQIRTIERIPSYITIDKDKAIRELLEKRRKDNSLVEKAIRRETSITKEYKNLTKYTPGILPKLIPQADRTRCSELEDVVGGLGLNDTANIYMNPATLTPGLAVAASGEYAFLEKISKSKKSHKEGISEGFRNVFDFRGCCRWHDRTDSKYCFYR